MPLEVSWKRHLETIDREALSSKQVEDEKLILVNAMRMSYKFTDYTAYERLNTMHKDANKYVCLSGRHKGLRVWDAICLRFKADVDGTKLLSDQFASWFKLVADAMRILKHNAPEAVVETAILGLPRTGDALCASRLVPEGVPVIRSEHTGEQNIKQLIRHMSGTKTITKHSAEKQKG